MTSWKHITDPSPSPSRVWFSRISSENLWCPLRKSDCERLNSRNPGTKVLVEGGRATADPENRVIRYNFYSSPDRELTSGIWFERKEKDELIPISAIEEKIIEDYYQRILEEKISPTEEVSLENESYKVVLDKSGGKRCLRKKNTTKSMFLTRESLTDLQRGYGEYDDNGEKEEHLGPVKHLIFVIHGIGEAMWSRKDVSIPSIVDEVDTLRSKIHRKQYDSWKKLERQKNKTGTATPIPPNRIEFIPIEWHDCIHSNSSKMKQSLTSSTMMNSIPKIRALCNDVLFDVLMYMTPQFCDQVLKFVIDQICHFHAKFISVHQNFSNDGGKCSLIGHSLGSVISWDILSILKDQYESSQTNCGGSGDKSDPIIVEGVELLHSDSHAAHYAFGAFQNCSENEFCNGSWKPNLPKKIEKRIPFHPAFTIFLGSPLGLFLTLRGAHPIFDEMRTNSNRRQKSSTDNDDVLVSPFTLPSDSIFNIINPNDPVAYRIEPLLMSPESTNIPPPHRLGEDRFYTSVSDKVAVVTDLFNPSKSPSPKTFPLGGKSNRVDIQIQGKVGDEMLQYVNALSAHSSYFTNDDVIEFLVKCGND